MMLVLVALALASHSGYVALTDKNSRIIVTSVSPVRLLRKGAEVSQRSLVVQANDTIEVGAKPAVLRYVAKNKQWLIEARAKIVVKANGPDAGPPIARSIASPGNLDRIKTGGTAGVIARGGRFGSFHPIGNLITAPTKVTWSVESLPDDVLVVRLKGKAIKTTVGTGSVSIPNHTAVGVRKYELVLTQEGGSTSTAYGWWNLLNRADKRTFESIRKEHFGALRDNKVIASLAWAQRCRERQFFDEAAQAYRQAAKLSNDPNAFDDEIAAMYREARGQAPRENP